MFVGCSAYLYNTGSQRVVSSVRDKRTQMLADRPVAMVSHSDADLLIPVIRPGQVPRTLPRGG
jgi:hypothetical protein